MQGLIQQVDTGKLFEQQNALFNKFLEEKQKEFDEWFNAIKEMVNITSEMKMRLWTGGNYERIKGI